MKYQIFVAFRGEKAKTKAKVSGKWFAGSTPFIIERQAGESWVCAAQRQVLPGDKRLIAGDASNAQPYETPKKWAGFTLFYRKDGQRQKMDFTSNEEATAKTMMDSVRGPGVTGVSLWGYLQGDNIEFVPVVAA